jgi:L-histidine N-alpha-methyltransferase
MRTRTIDDVMARDVIAGLGSRPRTLPSKYFYDARGSELFEEICELEEYYPTRCEVALLRGAADLVVGWTAPDEIVELGAGGSRKARILLDAVRRAGGYVRYVPIDVSESALAATSRELARDYPEATIEPRRGDFLHDLATLEARSARLVAFLGSTLGNLEDGEALPLLEDVRGLLGPGGAFLVGVDLVKDTRVIERAYNDARGVTAAFNRNILRVVSGGLGGDARPELFEHVAFFDPVESRIEMHLRARVAHTIRFEELGFDVPLEAGETIRTEISRKWRRGSLEALLRRAGLELDAWITDERGWYALALAVPSER